MVARSVTAAKSPRTNRILATPAPCFSALDPPRVPRTMESLHHLQLPRRESNSVALWLCAAMAGSLSGNHSPTRITSIDRELLLPYILCLSLQLENLISCVISSAFFAVVLPCYNTLIHTHHETFNTTWKPCASTRLCQFSATTG